MVNYGKPGLIAMSLISYIYFTLGNINYEQYMNNNYYNMVCDSPIESGKCLIKG